MIFLPLASANGLLAQLEERLNGIEEVTSSNLVGSTNFRRKPLHKWAAFVLVAGGANVFLNARNVAPGRSL